MARSFSMRSATCRPLQAKLLRVTQNGTFSRVGSNREVADECAYSRGDEQESGRQSEGGTFREDLFYRLNVVELNIPALRERPEDILPLAAHFIAEFTQGKAQFSSALADGLARYAWPGMCASCATRWSGRRCCRAEK